MQALLLRNALIIALAPWPLDPEPCASRLPNVAPHIITQGAVAHTWPSVRHARGVVTHKVGACDYFLVETAMGFDLLEWYGGNDPDEGDVLVGDFESYGFKNIYNTTAKSELRVWVEDFWLNDDDALEQLYDQCG